MSSPPSSSQPGPPQSRKAPQHAKRKIRNLRNATFIIPSTNERVKRHMTLRNPSNFDGPPREESSSSEEVLHGHSRRQPLSEHIATAKHNIRTSIKKALQWLQSPTGKGVLKCSIVYMLGCLGTFVPVLSSFLGHQDGKHMVATICVYFHPARSAGSMIEAVWLAILAFLYAAIISIASMAVSVLCETQFDLIELGYIIVLVVFCGGGLGFVGWIKQKYSKPLVNVACSLASLAIITVLTKENAVQTAVFSDDKITQVLKMLVLAIVAVTAVCLLVWPVSARTELRKTMIAATDGLGDMLTVVSRSFLSGSEVDLQSDEYQDLASRYKIVFTQLTKNLKEAKAEHYVLGTEKQYDLEAKLVNCMQRLSQAIGGLRSAAMTQFTLLKETPGYGSSTPAQKSAYQIPEIREESFSSPLRKKQDKYAVLTSIDERVEESEYEGTHDVSGDTQRHTRENSDLSMFMPSARTPSDIFSRFIMHLGPSMKSLAYTLSQILLDLPFGDGPEFKITINEYFRNSLMDAIALYRGARREALDELYKSKVLAKERGEDVEADFEEVAASCGYFSFSLLDFAEELETYLEILEDLREQIEGPSRRSWSWLKFWRAFLPHTKDRQPLDDGEAERLIDANDENEVDKDLPHLVMSKRDTAASERQTMMERASKFLLNIVVFLQRDDIRFAVKVGAGAALWAMFAFIPDTRPFYGHWRGEWGLLSYMLVCSMTLGASNTTGYARFLGTLIGAGMAIAAWTTCQGNVYALAFCSWIASLICFYIIVAKGQAPFGRFILLTYNLSALYAYSLSVKEGDDDEDEGGVNPIITEIALHRVTAVLAGCAWGLIVTRLVWPISAREKFKDGLSVLWLRMGLVWKRDPLAAVVNHDASKSYMNIQEESALQRHVARLENLRSAATHEFELRGPFPQAQSGRIMEATNRMLDAFHSLNAIVQKDLKASPGEAAILKYTSDERSQLCSRISHLFQVLASSMKLEYPMSDAVPRIVHSRDKLLAKIWQFRISDTAGPEKKDDPEAAANGSSSNETRTGDEAHAVGQTAKDEDYALLYAYALVTGQVAEEIKKVEKEIESLFGVFDEHLIQLDR